jgi:hypothetical protein
MASALRAWWPAERGHGSAHRGGRPKRFPAARTMRSAPWSPRAWCAGGVATSDGSNGEVRHDAQNLLRWVEADAPGNSLAAETHRGGTTLVMAAWQGLTVAEAVQRDPLALWWACDARR